MKKLLLILIYPFVYLFHPRIRRANALRIKYWAMDKDFFREERKAIGSIGLLSVIVYGGLVYGIPALYLAGGHIVKASFENVGEVNKVLISPERQNITNRVSANIEVKTEVSPAYANIRAIKAEKEAIGAKKYKEPEDEISDLIKSAKQQKAKSPEQ
jgi:hypothetical protein